MALDAIAFDTETTGLDPARARFVEIGALRLRAGVPVPGDRFRSLVDPGIAIPEGARAIHRIGGDTVAGAPGFADIWPAFTAWAAGSVWIAHSAGFDLAIARRECARTGLRWDAPCALDVRILAEICAPRLGGFELDRLAAWLGVDIEGRHSALGDAAAVARIFVALVPKLREAGIRTLGEALHASQRLTRVLDEHRRAGWVEPATVPESERTRHSDLAPYLHRVRDVMSPPFVMEGSSTLTAALAEMTRRRISSVLVRRDGDASRLAALGIVTERDAMRALAERGASALESSLSSLASHPLHTVPADALTQRAIGRMGRLQVRHLVVTGDDGALTGVISARDLLKLRAQGAIWLGDELDSADDVAALARAWSRLPDVARQLRAEGVSGRDVAALISEELRALTARAAVLAERKIAERGDGAPPCPYAVAVLGSAGRGESLLAMDQDNAIAFAEGEPDGAADRWFGQLGAILADILHEAGVPYCPGGVMAKNPQWRGSLATWRKRIDGWIAKSRPQDLLAVDIFFDLRAVSGDLALADGLWREAFDRAAGNVTFAKLLVEAGGAVAPGLGLFGRLRVEDGRTDLKRRGLFGIVGSARALAIAHHIAAHQTPARLDRLIARGEGRAQLEALRDAQGIFLDLLIDQQLRDIAAGVPPSNTVAVKALSPGERARLREAFRAVEGVDDLTRDLLFRG